MRRLIGLTLALVLWAGVPVQVWADDPSPYGGGPGVPHARTLPHTGDGPTIWASLRW